MRTQIFSLALCLAAQSSEFEQLATQKLIQASQDLERLKLTKQAKLAEKLTTLETNFGSQKQNLEDLIYELKKTVSETKTLSEK